jgi:hypothetical protein
MHDIAELIFHVIVGLLRALWAVCEFVFQCLCETAGDWMIDGLLRNWKPSRRQAERSGSPSE